MKTWDAVGSRIAEAEGEAASVSEQDQDDIGHFVVEDTRDKVYEEGYLVPPVPYDENAVPASRRAWVPDFHDQLIPKRKGFISDFVFHTRGIMTPTLASIWSALFVLQSAIKREAWLQWYPKPLEH